MYRFLLAANFFLAFSALPNVPHQSRIAGGTEAVEGQFPYFVTLFTNDSYDLCSGVIIDTKWVLTAAECVDLPFEIVQVLAGTYLDYNNGSSFSINQTFLHEEYDVWTNQNDIALIQLNDTFTYSDTIQSIQIGEVDTNANCWVIGWGMTDTIPFSDIVQFITESTIDLETCSVLAENSTNDYYVDFLGETQICALPGEDMSITSGDKGGPMVCDGKLAGIMSFSFSAYTSEGPDIFTKVASYQSWIDAIISAN